jgi:hypothetical protein
MPDGGKLYRQFSAGKTAALLLDNHSENAVSATIKLPNELARKEWLRMTETTKLHLFVTRKTKIRNGSRLYLISVTKVTNIFLHRGVSALNVRAVHGRKEF